MFVFPNENHSCLDRAAIHFIHSTMALLNNSQSECHALPWKHDLNVGDKLDDVLPQGGGQAKTY